MAAGRGRWEPQDSPAHDLSKISLGASVPPSERGLRLGGLALAQAPGTLEHLC